MIRDILTRVGLALVLLAGTLPAQTNPVPGEGPPLIVGPFQSVLNLASMPAASGCGNVKADAGVTDNAPIINCAITYAMTLKNLSGTCGVILTLPSGDYGFFSTITFPATTVCTLVLRGSGMRTTYLRPIGPSTNFTATGTSGVAATILFGCAVPSAAGASPDNCVTQYEGLEDISVNGSLLTTGNFRAVVITECQYCWWRNGIIEAIPGQASVGLYLRGSTVTGGLGTNTTAFHTRLNTFSHLIVTNIGTCSATGGTPATSPSAVVLQNADENNFDEGSTFAVVVPCTSFTTDSVYTFWVQLGRNNRCFGCLWSGDDTNKKGVALKFGPPINEAGTADGSVLQNQDYGAVGEGFDRTVWFGGDNSGNTLGNVVNNFNAAVSNTPYKDDNAALAGPGQFVGGGSGANCFFSPLVNVDYCPIGGPSIPMGVFANLATTPSIGGADHWETANTGGTIITDFLAPTGASLDGRILQVLCNDANTTIRDVNNGGGGHIRNYGRRDIRCNPGAVVEYRNFNSLWIQTAPIAGYSGSSQVTIPNALTCGSGTTPGIDVSTGNYFTCNITSNVAVVLSVPTNNPPTGSSQTITVAFRNTSGGALTTAPTFNTGAGGFVFGASTCNPTNGTQCQWTWAWDGTQTKWELLSEVGPF